MSLQNPMRFSLRHHTINVQEWINNQDVEEPRRQVDDIDMRPSEGSIEVYWSYVGDGVQVGADDDEGDEDDNYDLSIPEDAGEDE